MIQRVSTYELGLKHDKIHVIMRFAALQEEAQMTPIAKLTNIKKSFVLFLFIALIMSVTGCAPTAPTATQTPIVEATTIPPTVTPLPTATATPFVPKATIKIVSQSPASTDIAHAAELAVEQLQRSVNDLGYKVEFVPYDDQQKIDVAIMNAKQIVKDPQVLCGVGHYNSPIMIQASQVYHAAGLAFVSPSSTDRKSVV
jgi:branched-chain amino acid transport system substrate-binding protein